ncbi:DUF3566 domain-containing protein [Mycolicibacterium austroafricanum]|uniref:DUF3566 domain-containing protein n=1 Tax=Mycolicibacterium austroafricanum TaxID=39687 RepID=UPI00056193DC|nr:DUF3566 domain-containing protein [Mycolicibacterium austroafricanum]QZY46217.1 DUF3566 domain-containing protein [Mycolicibacterium austroafricanum]
MSSPQEPGYPRAGEAANGSPAGSPGSGHDGGPRPAHTAEGADVPPWQRGPAGRARQHQAPEGAQGEGPRPNAPGGLDARLNRFMAGGSAPAGSQETEPAPAQRNARTEVVRTEGNRPEPGPRPDQGAAYASEIPDLSGPRPPQQRKPVDRPVPEQQPKPAPKPAPPAGNRAVQVATRAHTGPVRASMQIRRVDPWSTLKVSLLLSVVLFFVWMIAVAFLYLVLGGMGVWSKLNSNVGDLLTSASGSSGGELVSSGTIFGGAALIGLVNIVLLTAAATIGAFIYNLTTDLVGGVEVTLADRD